MADAIRLRAYRHWPISRPWLYAQKTCPGGYNLWIGPVCFELLTDRSLVKAMREREAAP